MNRQEEDPLQSGPSYAQVTLLARWLTVIADFHYLHAQLSACLLAYEHPSVPSPEVVRWVGQCDMDQVRLLLSTMHNELETMLTDANQFDRITRQEGYEHLAIHVAHVEQLNQQANTLLCLMALPTG